MRTFVFVLNFLTFCFLYQSTLDISAKFLEEILDIGEMILTILIFIQKYYNTIRYIGKTRMELTLFTLPEITYLYTD